MRKPTRRKSPIPKRTNRKKKGSSKSYWGYGIIFFLLMILGLSVYHYRTALAYYFSFRSRHHIETTEASKVEEARIFQIAKKHHSKVLGFDVSEYQGTIDWEQAKKMEDTFALPFVFIRATAGKDKVDKKFETNWKKSKANGMIRGAYHYYRPNENSIKQADLFIKTVRLEKGDLPPVLDIENLPKTQSMDSLKVGLKRWLQHVEAHYNVKPIIYSGESYYTDFLKKEFKEYPFWIANYNFFVENIKDEWLFWQFTDKGSVPGIKGPVDINVYNGTPKMLGYLTIGGRIERN